MFKLILFCKIL